MPYPKRARSIGQWVIKQSTTRELSYILAMLVTEIRERRKIQRRYEDNALNDAFANSQDLEKEDD